jgi:hypothetical protein
MPSARFTSTVLKPSRAILLSAILSCGSDGDGGTGIGVPDVATVTVAPAISTIGPGVTVQLQATIKDANGATLSDRQVTWSSSDDAIATVSPSGLVTGVADGTATMTGTSEGKSGTASVVVQVPVASVVVEPDAAALASTETVQLVAATLDAAGNTLTDRQVTWSSDNTGVAAVSETGLVTGVADGTANISASSEGQSGSAVITVTGGGVAGLWLLHETLSDDNLGYACDDFQNMTIVQSGATFTGTSQQTGSCTLNGQTFDNSDTYQVTNGRINGSEISFTQPGTIPCVYEGELTPPLMSGTVSCRGSVDGTQVNATGTWCAQSLAAGAQHPRVARQHNIRRIPSCT